MGKYFLTRQNILYVIWGREVVLPPGKNSSFTYLFYMEAYCMQGQTINMSKNKGGKQGAI